MEKNALVLLSGGIDSAVTAFVARKQEGYQKLKVLFFSYGQRALREELFCCRKLCKMLGAELKVVDLKWLGMITSGYTHGEGKFPRTTEKELEEEDKHLLRWWVPCRNAVFIISALAYAEAEYLKSKRKFDVLIGLKNEGRVHMKDTTPEFLDKINALAKEAAYHNHYVVRAPLLKLDKPEVIQLGEKLRVPWRWTYSCYIGKNIEKKRLVHCGICLNCMLRKKGFYWAGVDDSTLYTLQ